MRTIRIAVLLSSLISFTVHAESYGVQIGTYRNPDRDLIEDRVEDIGEIHTSMTATGLTRFHIGSFASLSEAEDALQRLQGAGFEDAFILGQVDPQLAGAEADERAEPSLPQGDSALLSSLSEEERRSVVYLDGRLHKKIGDQFIPLESALDEDRAR